VFFGVARSVHYDRVRQLSFTHSALVAEFAVFVQWKGASRESLTVLTEAASGMGGFPFKKCVPYLVYGLGKGDTIVTSACDRTRADSAAYADMEDLPKPAVDRTQRMGWKQYGEFWRAANGCVPVILGPTIKN